MPRRAALPMPPATPDPRAAFRFQLDGPSARRLSLGSRVQHLERVHAMLGCELPQAEVARRLRYWVQAERAPVVGALHTTCSDEAEQEQVDAFHRTFATYLLPSLKFFEKAAFRTANLGGRYEWGAVRVAEEHFSLARGADDWKLLVVKLNSHVSVSDEPGGPVFGRARRFGGDSTFCGALHALIDGTAAPFGAELHEAFASEGLDRLARLHDAVAPEHTGLFAAAVNARLQARRAMLDLQDHTPRTPTLYVVLPCVSLNRRGHDTEIVVGFYAADRRGDEPHDEYCGLSDDPGRYELRRDTSGLELVDPHLHEPRMARDHRALVVRELERAGLELPADPRLAAALATAEDERRTHSFAGSKAALSALLPLLVELSPVPAAAVLFGSGLVRIHQAGRAHALLVESQRDEAATAMLRDVQQQVGALSPEEARHAIALLLDAYRR